MVFLSKVLLAALIIAFASWLSGKRPELSGFIIALPIASIIAIAFSYLEHKNTENTVIFAKSILIGVPVSYLFFVPFFFAKKERYEKQIRYRNSYQYTFCKDDSIFCIFVF